MSQQSICVIGCSGFIGSHVTALALQRGYTVHGTLRDPEDPANAWVRDSLAKEGAGALKLFAAEATDKESLKAAMQGTSGVIMCAGVERQHPETLAIMRALALNTCEAALELGLTRAVFTSSTGSTNPPEGEPGEKREMDHWSDITAQLAAGKYAPAAKTLSDIMVLGAAQNSGGALRTATINPSLVAGPCFQAEPVASLRLFAAILGGARMSDGVPNTSMSMIDVRDLAALHIAALENPDASGRYFGVKQSWHWNDILSALERVAPGYKKPPMDKTAQPVRATAFDLSRQNILGTPVRDLEAILSGVMAELIRRKML